LAQGVLIDECDESRNIAEISVPVVVDVCECIAVGI